MAGEAILGILLPGEPDRHGPVQRSCPPRLFVLPRLDLLHASAATDIDEMLRTVKHLAADVFDTEQSATEFYQQHLSSHNPPVFLSSLKEHTGPIFGGRRFSEYRTAPAEAWVGVALDFLLDNPIRCCLAEDWQFHTLEILANQSYRHKTVLRYPQDPARELREALYDVEAELYDRHPVLSKDALRDFWSSFEVHKHLTLHAVKMQRYHDGYSDSITQALDYVRRHVADYVTEVLGVDSVCGEREITHGDLARKIQSLKADWGATVGELEDLFNLDRKTLRRVELGEALRQSTMDKAPASRVTLDQLRCRLLENRGRKHRLS
jgi:hypothetical protein